MNSVEMTPEQLRAQAALLMEQAKQAERESAEREREAQRVRELEAAERAAREIRTKYDEFCQSLTKRLNEVLTPRGVTIAYDPEAAWSRFTFSTHPREGEGAADFPSLKGERINIDVERSKEKSGLGYRQRTTFNGRHDIVIGDYGDRKRYKEKADGSISVDKVAEAVYDQALRVVHRRRSETAAQKAEAIVDFLKERFSLGRYDSTVSVAFPAGTKNPVTFNRDGIRVDYDGSVEKTERLLAMAAELKKLINDKG